MQKVFFIFLFPSFLFCQAEFTENDEFGISGGYTLSGNDVISSSSFDFVFTMFGVLDVGFQSGSGEADYEFSSSQIKTNADLFYAAYCVKRRNNNLVLKVLAGYYTGTAKSPFRSEISSTGLLLGLGVYPRIITAKQLSIRLALELSYGFLSTSTDGFYYSDDDDFDNSRSLSLGINWLLDLTKNFHIVFSPFIAKDLLQDENSVFYGLNSRIFVSFETVNNTY